MGANSFVMLSLTSVLELSFGTAALADCTAGNANSSVAETTPDADFKVDAVNGTVTHARTGLMWKRCVEGQSDGFCGTPAGKEQSTFDWGGALAAANFANSMSFAGYSDWRLPNKKELESIAELCGYRPAVNQNVFPGTPVDNFFWSATTYLRDPEQAWMVTSGNGASGFDRKDAAHYVRLVRGGQLADLFDMLQGMRRVTGHFPRLVITKPD